MSSFAVAFTTMEHMTDTKMTFEKVEGFQEKTIRKTILAADKGGNENQWSQFLIFLISNAVRTI